MENNESTGIFKSGINGMTYYIYGKYQNLPKEIIDEAETEEEANYLLGEYRLAFGSNFLLWIVKK